MFDATCCHTYGGPYTRRRHTNRHLLASIYLVIPLPCFPSIGPYDLVSGSCLGITVYTRILLTHRLQYTSGGLLYLFKFSLLHLACYLLHQLYLIDSLAINPPQLVQVDIQQPFKSKYPSTARTMRWTPRPLPIFFIVRMSRWHP